MTICRWKLFYFEFHQKLIVFKAQLFQNWPLSGIKSAIKFIFIKSSVGTFGLILRLWAYFVTFIGLIGQNLRSSPDQSLITQTPNFRHVWHIIDTLLTVWWQMLSLDKYPVTKSLNRQVHGDSIWPPDHFLSSDQILEGRTCLLQNDLQDFRFFKVKKFDHLNR